MKAAVVHGIKDVRYEEIETPRAEPGKVLIKVKYTGICGSDVPGSTREPAITIPMCWAMSFPASWRKSERA